ncbi:MAG: diacylglycerol kinase family protein [Patescibacteria group bacterium]
MHVYIYDSFVNTKKYDNVLAQIETRITDLGLNGKIIRLNVMKNINEAVKNELQQGAKTIVAVGNDNTVNQIINSIIRAETDGYYRTNVPLGIIPIGEKNNSISSSLGIGEGEEACDVLSARRIEKLDMGQANNYYFLSQATITAQGTVLDINPSGRGSEVLKNYSIEIMEHGAINIINLSTFNNLPENINPNPQDGKLELFIYTNPKRRIIKLSKEQNQSFFSIKKLIIQNNKSPLTLDNSLEIPTPVEISILSRKLDVIVGKERGF